ncbi:MAG: Serine/threonine protein kinase [Nitrospira sp.]|jgi:serine/threonine-protein kinase|nr:MAG: Serine/threonine protein kinase [Nitrospira sp.]
MTTSWGWIGPYLIVIILAILVGPLLATLPLFTHTFVRPLRMNAAQAVRLVADGICLLMIWLAAARATRELHDNGKGQTFLRCILPPAAFMLIVLMAYRAYELHGIPALGPPKQPLYHWLLTGGLIGSATWLTFAWARHADALTQALVGRQRRRPVKEENGEKEPAAAEAPVTSEGLSRTPAHSTGTVILRNGYGPPAALGRYQILKELGRGAMGVVYLGKDPTIQRFVAIKTMRLDEIDNDDELKQFRDRFFREAESNGRLSHPNIITVYDAGEQDGLAYIAMEYLEGTMLSCYCQKTTLLPAKQALQIVAAVADALDYAHSQGVVHRDVKPANIMIMKQRLVKVMDFGIAKMASASKTQTSMILGTPRYMSPEQATGKDVDGRSDVFSLGIVLFELLSGERPFDAENMPALVMRIAKAPHPPLLKYRRDLPTRVQSILDRALQKEIPNRYRHAGDLAQDLRDVFQVMPR